MNPPFTLKLFPRFTIPLEPLFPSLDPLTPLVIPKLPDLRTGLWTAQKPYNLGIPSLTLKAPYQYPSYALVLNSTHSPAPVAVKPVGPPTMRPPRPIKEVGTWQDFWKGFGAAVYSLDFDFYGNPVNGGKAGRRYSEFQCRKMQNCPPDHRKPLRPSTEWEAGTTSHWHGELRPIRGRDESQVVSVFVEFLNKDRTAVQPTTALVPGFCPLKARGFYAYSHTDESYSFPPELSKSPLFPWGAPVEAPPTDYFELKFLMMMRGSGCSIPILGGGIYELELALSGGKTYLGPWLLSYGLIRPEDYNIYHSDNTSEGRMPFNVQPRRFGDWLDFVSFFWDGRGPEMKQRSVYYNPNVEDRDRIKLELPNPKYYASPEEEQTDLPNVLAKLPKLPFDSDHKEDPKYYSSRKEEYHSRLELGIKLPYAVRFAPDPNDPTKLQIKPNPLFTWSKTTDYFVRFLMREHQLRLPYGTLQFKNSEIPTVFKLTQNPQTKVKDLSLENVQLGYTKLNINRFTIETSGLSVGKLEIKHFTGFSLEGLAESSIILQDLQTEHLKITGPQGNVIFEISGTAKTETPEIKRFELSFKDGVAKGSLQQLNASELKTSHPKIGMIRIFQPKTEEITFRQEKDHMIAQSQNIEAGNGFSIIKGGEKPFELSLAGKLALKDFFVENTKEGESSKKGGHFEVLAENTSGKIRRENFGDFNFSTLDPRHPERHLTPPVLTYAFVKFDGKEIQLTMDLPHLSIGADSKFFKSDLKDSYVENAHIEFSPHNTIFQGIFHFHFTEITLADFNLGIPNFDLDLHLQNALLTGPAHFEQTDTGVILTKPEGNTTPLSIKAKFGKGNFGEANFQGTRLKYPLTPSETRLQRFQALHGAHWREKLAMMKTEFNVDAEFEIADIRLLSFDRKKVDGKAKVGLNKADFGPITLSHLKGNAKIWADTVIWGLLPAQYPEFGVPGPAPHLPKFESIVAHLSAPEKAELEEGDFLRIGRFTLERKGEQLVTHIKDFLLKLHETPVPKERQPRPYRFKGQYFIAGIPEIIVKPRGPRFLDTGRLPIFIKTFFDVQRRGGTLKYYSRGTYRPPDLD